MVSPADIEAKARELADAVEATRQSARDTAVLAGVAIAILVVVAFVMGRRRGKRNKALVEVYRV